MKWIYTVISCLAINPIGGYELDPDTWFAVYDDDYITTVEILGHMYQVKIISHEASCRICNK